MDTVYLFLWSYDSTRLYQRLISCQLF